MEGENKEIKDQDSKVGGKNRKIKDQDSTLNGREEL